MLLHYIPVNITQVVSKAKEASVDRISILACLHVIVSSAKITHSYKSKIPEQIDPLSVLTNIMAHFPKMFIEN